MQFGNLYEVDCKEVFMTVITFDDNLITGNKTIDEQHKELIDRIQQFVSACESEDARVKAI